MLKTDSPILSSNRTISRITLGTVQFGLDYGIANQDGKPAYETCREIIAEAFAAGIRCFDTAASYGESEIVLGRALQELGIAEEVVIVSKSRPVDKAHRTLTEVEKAVEDSLHQSLKNLRLERLPVFLYHREEDVQWMDVLTQMKERDWVEKIGVSVDSAQGAVAAANESQVEALQLPHNLFDHRFFPGPLFQRLVENQTLVFARSAFLQGLLLLPEARIPKSLETVLPVRRKVEALAREAGMGMPELCLRYSLSYPEITSVLIGVDTVDQLKSNATMAQRGPLGAELLASIQSIVPDFPESIVRPILWSKDS